MWPIFGHEFAVKLMLRSIQTHTVSHAYLIAGLPHIGKTTLAQTFAQALNCTGAAPPCQTCRSCQLGARHPDISIIEPERGRIKIGAIRTLQSAAALSPIEGRYRIYVISQIDTATLSAANCLLKTLEEPPERVVLILTANRIAALLPTIVSRCQVLNLRPLPASQVISALQPLVDQEQANLLGHLAQGRIGWAYSAASEPRLLEQRNHLVEQLLELDTMTYTERFAFAERQSKKPEQIPELLYTMRSWWRDILLLAAQSKAPVANIDRQAELEQIAAQTGVDTALAMLRSIDQTAWRLEHNANSRLALEVLLLDMPSKQR